jgi:hypothetical protein
MERCRQGTEKLVMMETLKVVTVAQTNVQLNICGHAHSKKGSCRFARRLHAETEN